MIIASDEFPMGKLMECTGAINSIDDLEYYATKYWMVVKVAFKDLRLRNPYRTKCPYIPVAKTQHELRNDAVYDNGRIISQPGITTFAFLGMEWPIIKKQYTGQVKIIEAWYTVKGYLPYKLRSSCFDFYKLKTELKGIEGREYEYMKSKNRVNAYFGMMVEKIIKNIMEVEENGDITERAPTDEEARQMIEDYTNPRNRKFLLYQWGVTVTALARVRHMELIDITGDDFIYGDTDSVKCTHPEKYAPQFDKYNKLWEKYAEQSDVPIEAFTRTGDQQLLGHLDFEGDVKEFVTLGAKKYAYTDKDNRLHLTVAGVPKKQGAALLGSLDNFKPGFVFRVPDDAALQDRQMWKKVLTYRDDLDEDAEIDGHTIHLYSCIAMERTEYKLDITDDYRLLTGYNDFYTQDGDAWE